MEKAFEVGDRCCNRCGYVGPLEHYAKSTTARFGYQNKCKRCAADIQRAKNPVRLQRHRQILRQAKDVPCADCGVRYPAWVMDFDHVRGEKKRSVGYAIGIGWSDAKLHAEIAKCDVVCANCHRQRSHDRGHLNGRPRAVRFLRPIDEGPEGTG
jgi:hypothetical protein